jgi:shikimate dehydrogenase
MVRRGPRRKAAKAAPTTTEFDRVLRENAAWFARPDSTADDLHVSDRADIDPGLIADLERNHAFRIEGRRILLLGAGGAARGVIMPLLERDPELLLVANRTLARAEELVDHFRSPGALRAAALGAIPAARYDLVLNATSTSTLGERLALDDRVLGAATLAYDMAYGPAAAAFLDRARAAGARACDGLGMLVEQAAESFFLWRGRRPETAALVAELRSTRA